MSATPETEPLVSAGRLRVRALLEQVVATVDAEQIPMADVLEELAKVAGVGLGLYGARSESPKHLFLETMARWFERVADVAVKHYAARYKPRPRPFPATHPTGQLLN